MNNNQPLSSLSLSSSSTDDQQQQQIEEEETTTTQTPTTMDDLFQEPTSMKIKDIQLELLSLNISHVDCFDRRSLVQRLVDARQRQPIRRIINSTTTTPSSSSSSSTLSDLSNTDISSSFKKEDQEKVLILSQLRSMSVKELRTECSKYNIRWGFMIEKEDFIQALLPHYYNRRRMMMNNNNKQVFSLTGHVIPGQVLDISDFLLKEELQPGNNNNNTNVPPLLLDIYATWCGPCQIMAKQLNQVAQELGSSLRIVKLDSDKYPQQASTFHVQGLPTLILFHGMTGQEIHRIEGVMMKDTLIQVLQKYILY